MNITNPKLKMLASQSCQVNYLTDYDINNLKIGDVVYADNGYGEIKRIIYKFNIDRGFIESGLQGEIITLNRCYKK